MLYPSMTDLIKGSKQCRYSLVIAVAKEARNIAKKAELNEIKLIEKPIKLAVNAFASGKASYKESDKIED